MKHVKLFEQFINKSVNEGSKSEELSEFNKKLYLKYNDKLTNLLSKFLVRIV